MLLGCNFGFLGGYLVVLLVTWWLLLITWWLVVATARYRSLLLIPTFSLNEYRVYMNEVFRPAENISINTRNSLAILSEKPVPDKTACLILDLLFGREFLKF